MVFKGAYTHIDAGNLSSIKDQRKYPLFSTSQILLQELIKYQENIFSSTSQVLLQDVIKYQENNDGDYCIFSFAEKLSEVVYCLLYLGLY